MSGTGRALAAASRFALRETFIPPPGTSCSTVSSVRFLALSSRSPSKKPSGDEEVKNEPIRFSTSRGSHRAWQVQRSMGSHFQRPWWKVLPLSLLCCGFLLWCTLRPETQLDLQLEKHLYEHLPGLLSDEEDDKEDKDKSS
ncbi:ubiquinol-cytochrome c reductase complex assembly factor 4 [Genypterus blacodes]|uniref:ubiquinol-cytochrome c reductase complex assembly factor 4 n=1 Tax=Genypterus blacodes TaxID=154954 RepID=UPI003F7638EE